MGSSPTSPTNNTSAYQRVFCFHDKLCPACLNIVHMTFDEYQARCRVTAKYPDVGRNFIYPTLGLSGEAGEVAEKIKKVLRDKGGVIDDEVRENIKKELGDVLWYVAQLATELGLSLDDIADTNLKKLLSRLERGVISGNGDNR